MEFGDEIDVRFVIKRWMGRGIGLKIMLGKLIERISWNGERVFMGNGGEKIEEDKEKETCIVLKLSKPNSRLFYPKQLTVLS